MEARVSSAEHPPRPQPVPTFYRYLFPAMWLIWAAYWVISSRDASAAVRREPVPSRLVHIGLLTLAAILLVARNVAVPILGERMYPRSVGSLAIAALLTAAGLLFAAWARRYLGPHWSGTVTIKEGHELVTTGPYALVRHPIYTGLLLALAGSAMAVGEWRAALAVVLAAIALYRKIRLEERWMRERFGDVYREYSQRVPALIPFAR
jgi:protein-S-isoprenylcysteine O-methyltransferase Ste14